MSLTSSLTNAVAGMTVASRMAEIVSSNVSNAFTDGYGRRSLDMTSTVGGTVIRHIDRGVLGDRRLADASLAGFDSLVSLMGRVEDVVGQAGDVGSISARISAVESALIDAAANPSSDIRLGNVGARLSSLAEGLNTASDSIQDLRVRADASIAQQVDLLNQSLVQVEKLNEDIIASRLSGNDPSSLIDQRQQVIDKVAQIVPVRELDRDHGRVALMTPSGATLIDGTAREFDFTASPVITADMVLGSGILSVITLDGVPMGNDGYGRLAGGSLSAAFQARDVELVATQNGLDLIAEDLINRFQDPNVDPTLGSSDAGLLTDRGNPFTSGRTGLAGRIAVNTAIDPGQGGSLSNLRDGINSGGVGLTGDATLLQALSTALSEPNFVAGDPTHLGAAARASSIETDVGARRINFEAELSFATARWSGLKEAEAAGGVDTDYEMQILLRVETAYAANAKVIQTVDTLMQRLLEI